MGNYFFCWSAIVTLSTSVLVLACSDAGNTTNGDESSNSLELDGTEGGSCYGNGTCDSGLTCASDLCVSLDRNEAEAGKPINGDEECPSTNAGSTIDFLSPGPDPFDSRGVPTEETPGSSFCGNGILDEGEVCDHGVAIPQCVPEDSPCWANCLGVKAGYVCPSLGTSCFAYSVCGDGIVGIGEQCDDSNTIRGDGCSETCQLEELQTCVECSTGCGDGTMEISEQCDDGNRIADDGCSQDCTVEPGFDCQIIDSTSSTCTPICGDGLLRKGEQCDSGEQNVDGVYNRCGTSCQLLSGFCGDGILQEEEEEECDIANPNRPSSCRACRIMIIR